MQEIKDVAGDLAERLRNLLNNARRFYRYNGTEATKKAVIHWANYLVNVRTPPPPSRNRPPSRCIKTQLFFGASLQSVKQRGNSRVSLMRSLPIKESWPPNTRPLRTTSWV